MTDASATGVEIKLGFFPLAIFLVACSPIVEIDGIVHKKCWGRHFFPTSSGRHTIKVYFRYFFMARCGENSIDVNVAEGATSRLEYSMPPWMFAKGSLKSVG